MARKKISLSTSGEGKIIDLKTGKPIQLPVLPVICERVKYYRARIGIEQKELAERIGITKNSISNWENGRSRPDVNLLPGLCEVLGISLYDLFRLPDPTAKYTGRQLRIMDKYGRLSDGHKVVIEKNIDNLLEMELAEDCPNLTVLTHYDRSLAAGIGDPTEFDDEGEDVYLYSSPLIDRADCIFTVNGNSMEPDFHDGQDVLVERLYSVNDMCPGDIGAFITGNETYIKEYQPDGLYSLNEEYAPMYFRGDESVFLIGKVLGTLEKTDYATPEDIRKYEIVHGED